MAAAQARDEIAHDKNLVRVEADRRLVHDDHGRFGENRLRDADTLTGTFRKLAMIYGGRVSVALLEHLVDARAEFAARHFLQAAAKIKILRHAHVSGSGLFSGM